jgi:hypothetical protein
MLPGFRFLFAAIVLSMSLLVFGLGAAALLRAAHEEFASTPTWRAAPETVFAQPVESSRPVLALLRIDTPVTEKTPDNAPAAAAPDAPSAALAFAPADPERIAAPSPDDSPSPEAMKPETAAVEDLAQSEASSAPADPPAPAAETKIADTNLAETKIAETTVAEARTVETRTVEAKIPETTTPETKIATPEDIALAANETAVPQAATTMAPEPASKSLSPGASIAATKIATLGGPAVTISAPRPAKADSAKSSSSAIKKHLQARRAARRRRLAALARLAAQTQLQQPASPFGLPPAAPATVRRR